MMRGRAHSIASECGSFLAGRLNNYRPDKGNRRSFRRRLIARQRLLSDEEESGCGWFRLKR